MAYEADAVPSRERQTAIILLLQSWMGKYGSIGAWRFDMSGEEDEGEEGIGDFGHGGGGTGGRRSMSSAARDDEKTEATYLAVACEMASRFLSLNLVREDRTMAVVAASATAGNQYHAVSRPGNEASGTGPLSNSSPRPLSRSTPPSAVTHTTMDTTTSTSISTDHGSNHNMDIAHNESRVVVRVENETRQGVDIGGATVVVAQKRTFQAELDLEDQPCDTISPPPKRSRTTEFEHTVGRPVGASESASEHAPVPVSDRSTAAAAQPQPQTQTHQQLHQQSSEPPPPPPPPTEPSFESPPPRDGVQAPQAPCSQPTCVPVSAHSCLKKSTNVVRVSMDRE